MKNARRILYWSPEERTTHNENVIQEEPQHASYVFMNSSTSNI